MTVTSREKNLESSPAFSPGLGEMDERIRALNWAKTPLGPLSGWSPALQIAVRLLLANRSPMILWWGSTFCSVYNDAYLPILGAKHPWALGRPARDCLGEIWDELQPLIEASFNGTATGIEDLHLEVLRDGVLKEAHFSLACSAVPDESAAGGSGGVLATLHEITGTVIGERRNRILRELGACGGDMPTAESACTQMAGILSQHARDVPFALLYLIDAERRQAHLSGSAGLAANGESSPTRIDLDPDGATASPWPLWEAMLTNVPVTVASLGERFGGQMPPGPWRDPPDVAVVVPIRSSKADVQAGFLVAGVSARLQLDEAYRDFLNLAAAQIAAAIVHGRACEAEKQSAEALAAVRQAAPDLLRSDGMSPRVDVFALSRQLPTDPAIRKMPVILFSARPGEDLRLEGLLAGAFDRLDKPFSARELLSRVAGRLKMARIQNDAERRVRESSAKLQAAFSSMAEALFIANAEGRLTDFNEEFVRFFRFTDRNESHRNIADCANYLDVWFADGAPAPLEQWPVARALRGETSANVELRLRRKDTGETWWGSFNFAPIKDAGGGITGAVVAGHEITEQKGAELALCESQALLVAETEALARLTEASARLWRIRDLPQGLDEMLAATIDLLGADMGNIQLLEAERGVLTIAAQRGFKHDFLERFAEVSAEDGSVCGRALRSGERLVIEDVETDPPFAPLRPIAQAAVFRGVQSTSLIGRDGKPLGMLSTHFRLPHRPSEPDLRRLDLYVRQAADFLERCRAETALQESQGLLKAVLDSSPDAIFLKDRENRLLLANPATFAAIGKSAEDCLGKTDEEFFANPADGRAIMANDRRIMESARAESVDETVTTPSGPRYYRSSKVPYRDATGEVIGLLGTSRDVTEQRRAEMALHASERRFRAIFNHQFQYSALLTPDGRIVEISESIVRGTGIRPAEIVGQGFLDAPFWRELPETRAQWKRLFAEALKKPGPARAEAPYVTRDGSLRHGLNTVTALCDGAGVVECLLVEGLDITERKQAEEALRDSEAKYRSLFDNIGEGFCIVELIYDVGGQATDFRFLEVNQAFERHTGLKDAAGKLGSDMTPNVELYWLEIFQHAARKRQSPRFEKYHEATGRWYSAYASLVGVTSNKIGLVIEDITQRKRAELEARESKQRQAFLLTFSDALRAAVDADVIGSRAVQMLSEFMALDRCYAVTVDLAAGRGYIQHQWGRAGMPPLQPFYRLDDFPLSMSQALERTWVVEDTALASGLSQDERQAIEVLGQRAFIAPALRLGENKPVWALAAVSMQPRRWSPGEVALVEAVAERTWAAMERARAEAALRDSEERFRVAFANASVGFAINGPDFKFLDANPAYCAMIGYAREELLDLKGSDLQHPDDMPANMALAGQLVAGEIPNFNIENRYVRKDGASIWVRKSVSLARNADGSPRWILTLVEDVTQRKQAEEREERLIALMNHNPSLVFLKDEEGRYVYLNEAYEEQFALSKDWLGKTDFDFWPRESAELFRKNDQEVLGSGKTIQFLEDSTDKNGRRYCWLCYKFPFTDSRNQRYVGGIGIDVTDRKRAEEALEASEQTLLNAQRYARAGVWEVDLVANRVIWSEPFYELYGLPYSLKPCNENWIASIHPDDRPAVQAEYVRALEARDVQRIEFRILREGETRWLHSEGRVISDAAGRPVRITGITWDITEAKQAELALRDSRQQLMMALEAGQLGFWDWNIANGRAQFGGRWASMLGYDPAEITPHVSSWESLIHGDDREAVAAVLGDHLAGRSDFYECEHRLRHKDGSWRWVLTRGQVVERDAEGQPLRAIGTHADVTARREAENALLEADRLKDEFLAMLAHELRNPLAPIRNGLQVLSKVYEPNPTTENLLQMMQRQVIHLVRLVDDLLDVSRITRDKIVLRKERIDVARLVEHAVETSRPLIDAKHHQLMISAPPEALWVEVDPVRITQVFANLINNAAKYMEPGGRIHVAVQVQGGQVMVSVGDTGIGIQAEALPRIFDLFTQLDRGLDRTQGGLGIGLALVRRLVEMHGGKVSAHSDGPGRGSEFIVRLPVCASN